MNDDVERVLRDIAARGRDPGAAFVWERATDAATRRRRRRHVLAGSLVAVVIAVAIGIGIAARTTPDHVDISGAPTSVPGAAGPDAIVFVRDEAIWIVDPAGSRLHRLTPTGCCDSPAWSPDHSEIAFVHFGELSVMDADGTHTRGLGLRTIFPPAWSPDGTQLAFARSPAGGSNGGPLQIVDVQSGLVRTLTDTFAGRPSWSPDGAQIAFTGLDEPLHLDVVTVATGAVREIARNSDVEQFEPAWSPDGTQIAFATGNGIFATGADGRGRAQLAACVTPNCRPNEPTWSPDGTAIAYVSSGSGARQLFVAPVAGGSARQVTTGPNDVSTPAW